MGMGEENASVLEDACQSLSALKDISFVLAHVIEGVLEGVVHLLGAVVLGRLVVEINDV